MYMPAGVLRSMERQQTSRRKPAQRSPRRCPVHVQAPFASRSSCKWQSTDSGVLVQVLLSSQHSAWRLQHTGEETRAVFPVERRAAACTMPPPPPGLESSEWDAHTFNCQHSPGEFVLPVSPNQSFMQSFTEVCTASKGCRSRPSSFSADLAECCMPWLNVACLEQVT